MPNLNKRRFLTFALASGAAAALTACGGGSYLDELAARTVATPSGPNLVEVLVGLPQFSLLVEAVQAAGLVSTLQGAGPFTVFAPTNDAFVALLAELETTKEALFADVPLLTAVLTYHVVAGSVPSTAVQLGRAITTVQGGVFKVESGDGLTIFDGRWRTSSITAVDLAASNGVIHTVDTVLLPPDQDIVQVAQSQPDFSILVEAVVAAGLVDTLKGPGPFTVFAPTNQAFADLLAETGLTKEQLLAEENRDLLISVLTYHVVSGRVLAAEVPVGQPITTVQGATFTVDSSFMITDQGGAGNPRAEIVSTDILATNGVIHIIDKVIRPTALPVT